MPLLLLLSLPVLIFFDLQTMLWVGERIGIFKILALWVVTTILGGVIMRRKGFATFKMAQEKWMNREMPIRALFNGACFTMAGALLLVPGLITDVLGVMLLLSPVRAALYRGMGGYFGIGVDDYRNRQNPPPPRDRNVIEGEYTRLDD